MANVTISSKGQITLPAHIRRRLGLMSGTQMEVIEEPNGLRLVISRLAIKSTTISACIGIVTAPSKGVPRRLGEFDPATLARKGA